MQNHQTVCSSAICTLGIEIQPSTAIFGPLFKISFFGHKKKDVILSFIRGYIVADRPPTGEELDV